jgi:hypothetical protein
MKIKPTKIQKELLNKSQKISKQQNYHQHALVTERKFLQNVASKAKEFINKNLKSVKKNASKILKDIRVKGGRRKSTKTFEPGKMVMFKYNAKHKQLRHDKNPLVIMLGPSKLKKNLYLGLNIHHLPITQRVGAATFFAELVEKRKGKLTYDDVKPFIYKFNNTPILRSYYYTRVSKDVYEMDTQQYQVAAGLPTEKIVGG